MPEAPTFQCAVCGAPAQSGDYSCRYCGSGIATLCCARCFHMNMKHAHHCSGCGSELGLIVESELVAAQCSDCHHPLDAIREDAGTLLGCRQCGGQFVEQALLRSLLEQHEVVAQAFPDAPYQRPVARAAIERVHYRPCPVCVQRMNRKNFGGASGVIVDVCAKHGTWFDAGELPQVLAFVKSGGLIRERARAEQRLRQSQAHERELAGEKPQALAFDSLHTSGGGGGGDQSSFARDLLEFVLEVLRPSSVRKPD